ncbi:MULTISPECIES: hypothetical protein [unclassified Mesorhizobium]|uniref:hypothetical protein n=1 Tax=unclassified Mesorhizobium TaxID=325217 RepID=UPI00112B6DEC|nr:MULTISPECIES: hypothetical protein [unclassified Mesorhizobium]TPK59058.1 hypothetical protein FJ551_25955 [Mesorhizobium sp. B2-5-1]TPL06661.1 hypothetical protein FJ944_22790 [Mesorhizobium sp. B2-4-11]
MASLVVQIQRGNDWNLLSTVRVGAATPRDEAAARHRVTVEANRQLTAWQGHFPDHRLRVTEAAQ